MPIVEDACQAHGTTVGGRYAGTAAAVGCFSTHDRKPLATGEGGFVLTNDPDLAERVDFYTHLGHLRGQVHGVNYKLAARWPRLGCGGCPASRGSSMLAAATPDASSTGSHRPGSCTSCPTAPATNPTTTTSS